MSWVYCAPKSRIRMRSAWISECGSGECPAAAAEVIEEAVPAIGSGDPVIRGFLRDRHVVHVALAHTGARDAHEPRSRAHRLDILAPGIAHRGAQPTGELLDDGDDAALVGDPAFD